MFKRINRICKDKHMLTAVSVCLLTLFIIMMSNILTGCGKQDEEDNGFGWDAHTNSQSDELAHDYLYDFENEDGLSDSERFDRYTFSMFKTEVSSNTLDLHFMIAHPENYGIDSYEVTLGGYEDNLKEVKEEQIQLTDDLKQFDKNKLTKEQQITYDILVDYLELEKDVDDLYYYGDVFSPLAGIQQMVPVLLAEYTFREQKDIDEYLVLVSEMGEYFDSYMEFETKKAKEGLGVPDFTLDDTIEGCEEFIKEPEKNYLISTFDERIDALNYLSEEKKEEYKNKNKDIIINNVCPSYEKLIDNLESFKGKATNEDGLYYYDHGKEFYEYKIRTNVGSDWTIKKIKNKTEDFIDDQLGYIYDEVSKDSSLLDEWEDCEYTITDPNEIMEYLIEKNQKDFPVLEKVDYEIKSVPKALEDHINPAFYLTAPIDNINENVIYINHKYDDDQDLFPTLAHEGYPGHLYQIVISSTYDRNVARNLFSYSGFTEGFATYAEMYSYDYAPLSNKKLSGVMRADNATNLAISAYVDLRVNYYGWQIDDVKEFLAQLGIENEKSVRSLYEMVIEEPAEYMEYFIGYLEFLDLREKAENALGDKFDLCAFHEFLLETGEAPFYIVENYMNDWIEEQK